LTGSPFASATGSPLAIRTTVIGELGVQATIETKKRREREHVRIGGGDDTRKGVITDRFTARVLGLLLIALGLIIDVSCFVFVPAETRAKPGYPFVVLLPSLPIFALGAWVLRRGEKLKDADD
jgi:hypothetical protein